MRRIPLEERKISITFALDRKSLEYIERLAEKLNCSRSAIITEAVREFWEDQERLTDVSDFPDDVSEVGYNPYTGSYDEDL